MKRQGLQAREQLYDPIERTASESGGSVDSLRQWFSPFLMLQPFNIVPHIVVIPQP